MNPEPLVVSELPRDPYFRHPRGFWEATAKTAKENPDQWVCVPDQSVSVADQVKKGILKAFRPSGDFDAVCRKTHKGTEGRPGLRADIYIQYTGNHTAPVESIIVEAPAKAPWRA